MDDNLSPAPESDAGAPPPAETEAPHAPEQAAGKKARARRTLWMYALAGAVSAGAALGISELVSGFNLSAPSLVLAVGDAFIDVTPPILKDWAVDVFGANDKNILIGGMVVVTLLLGGAVGMISRRLPWVGAVAFAAFGALGFWLGNDVPLSETALTAISAAAAAVSGFASLLILRRLIEKGNRPDRAAAAAAAPPSSDRRVFLAATAGTAAVAAGAAVMGRSWTERSRMRAASRDEVAQQGLPRAAERIPDPSPSQISAAPGVSPLVTPIAEFYKVDTALGIPAVDLDSWTLNIRGLVDRPLQLTYQQIMSQPMVERYITLACVSNRVGGELVGNAKWLGVPLRTLVEEAGVRAEGTQLIGRSVDDFTVGFPTAALFDGREALLAVGMNDEVLPFKHGFPARLVVSGLYGYVSATKWLSEIEFARWEDFDAYWVPRGWAKEAPIKTQSRIDFPRPGQVNAGPITVAGVAWAQSRGITRVQVAVDGGPWREAQLPDELSIDSWRQWSAEETLLPGRHRIMVRAADDSGEFQTAERTPVRPDGATGYHTIDVNAV